MHEVAIQIRVINTKAYESFIESLKERKSKKIHEDSTKLSV